MLLSLAGWQLCIESVRSVTPATAQRASQCFCRNTALSMTPALALPAGGKLIACAISDEHPSTVFS